MPHSGLAVTADLVVEREGVEALRVRGDGPLVELRIRNARQALKVVRDAGLTSGPRRRKLSRVASLLAREGLTVEVRVGAVAVARAGAGVRTGLIPRFAGLEHVEVELSGLAACLFAG